MYATFFFPGLDHAWLASGEQINLPWLGALNVGFSLSGVTLVAVATCLAALWMAYRKVSQAGTVSQYLWVVVIGTVTWVIFASLSHFDPHMAFEFQENAFTPSKNFFLGLGSAMLIATYDYWGYYNVGFLGGEIKQPERNIPRAIVISIGLVSILYIVMNVGVIGVLPWQSLSSGTAHNSIISVMMEQIYGRWAGSLVTILIMVVAFASVFSLLLGYSRVPYAAAIDGNYFKSFGKLHPRGNFPYVSMLWLGGVAALCCFFSLTEVIAALVVIRISLQFLLQAIGLIVLRVRRPDLPRPFKMWGYPVPAVLAIIGFVYVVFARTGSLVQLRYAADDVRYLPALREKIGERLAALGHACAGARLRGGGRPDGGRLHLAERAPLHPRRDLCAFRDSFEADGCTHDLAQRHGAHHAIGRRLSSHPAVARTSGERLAAQHPRRRKRRCRTGQADDQHAPQAEDQSPKFAV